MTINTAGPFYVADYTANPIIVVWPGFGSFVTYPAVPGQHYITDAQTYAANIATLDPYKDADQSVCVSQHQFVGGPSNTVAFTFADQAQADAVLGSLV